MDIEIKVIQPSGADYVILDFTCGIVEPGDLAGYQALDPVSNHFAHKGVVIKGALPQWLLAYYIHVLHPASYIAVTVPRAGEHTAVVVATHNKHQHVGHLFTLNFS